MPCATQASGEDRTHNANLLANCWFIEDGCVVGIPERLAAVINLMVYHKFAYEFGKYKVESDNFFPEQTSKPYNSDSEVLDLNGLPVGSVTYTLAFLQHKMEKAIWLMEMLEQLDDPQVACTLLRTCVSSGKFCYDIRTVPSSLIKVAT